MYNVTSDIKYIGINAKDVDLFEGQYKVPNGMAYNSYVVLDEKVTVFDTVDATYMHEWLDGLDAALGGRSPDYLVVQHMEPDHSGNIANFMKIYPKAQIVANEKTFKMMQGFFGTDYEDRRLVVTEGDTLNTGKHTFSFVLAPMVHWPEVMVTYDHYEKALFSADAFGRFGTQDAPGDWADEARRYYIGIVGKYGAQVQALLKKAAGLEIERILPLHGPVLEANLERYLELYDTWSSYSVETTGIVVAYTSVYGNTKNAVEQLAARLSELGCPKVVVHDLARCDMSVAVADAFRYGKIVLATTTYNSELFPFMRDYIHHLTERGIKNRTIGLIENGTWASTAARIMRSAFDKCGNIDLVEPVVSIKSALNDDSKAQLEALAQELCSEYIEQSSATANKNDMTALFNIGYGLYVVTSNDGKKDNGLIVNTVTQVTNTPNRIAVTINKENYSHHVIKQTGIMNVCCLSVDAPFSVFETYGFKSGRNVEKCMGERLRSDNGLIFLEKYINSFMSLKVEQYVDFGTHGMFICEVTEARVLTDKDSMTYSFYHENVKPKPTQSGWVCKICGYVYEGDNLPDDYICPLCKHGVIDFEWIE